MMDLPVKLCGAPGCACRMIWSADGSHVVAVVKSISVSGFASYWTLAPYTSRRQLADRLQALGYDAFTPAPRPPSACLKDALERVCGGPRVLVRPNHDRNGWAVVNEHREPGQNRYEQQLHAIVDDSGLSFDPPDYDGGPVRSVFQDHLGLLPASTVGAALVNMLKKSFTAITLRDSGGFYWCAERHLPAWRAISEAVESCGKGGKSEVYILRTAMDTEMAKAIRDSLAAEVLKDANLLHQEISTGELGERALENRVETCKTLHLKVREYESILSQGLGHLHQAVAEVEMALGKGAMLMAS